MSERLKIEHKIHVESSWRNYQRKLQRTAVLRHIIKASLKYTALLLFLLFIGHRMIGGLGKADSRTPESLVAANQSNAGASALHRKPLWDKKDIRTMLDSKFFTNLEDKSFTYSYKGQQLKVDTSLDLSLQRFVQKKMNRSTSRYIGIVAINPATGKILSMASYDKTDSSNNLNIDSKFPAASLFKIITAAAAAEKCGFAPQTKLSYNGRKHTLYKSQLKDRNNKYTNRITFQDAFAQSVNPVFGKIGVRYLDGKTLEKYAAAFGFNREIGFEIPLTTSVVSLTDEPYHWAEIASGFNRETRISPLHAALITATILNRGQLIEPSIIDKITNETGETLYQSQIKLINRVITPEASQVVNVLMEATIRSGTAKKIFRGYRKDKILSRLNIGGKTGSIDNKAHDVRFDWFSGFAEEKGGSQKIVLSILVGHEKYIGTRASHYARMIFKHYFQDYFGRQKATIDKEQRS